MRLSARSAVPPSSPPSSPSSVPLLRGVADPQRLEVVAQLDLPGHAGDPGLDAVVDTLTAGLRVPLAVVDVVTPGLQTYPAETGIGVVCSRVPDALSFCAEVVDTGLPVLVPDAREHPAYRDNPLVRSGAVRAYAGHPLVHRGAVVGTVSVFDQVTRAFDARELQVLAAQARLAATVLSLRWAATHDALTGLANRRAALARAEAALAAPPLSLLFLDVDDFKAVNDEHGHAEGDAVLRVLAEVLRGAAAGGNGRLAVRWGGDEFLLLLPGAGRAEAEGLARQVVHEVRVSGTRATVTVGTATCSDGTRGWDALLRDASGAAAEGKRAGKDRAVRAVDRHAPSRALRSTG